MGWHYGESPGNQVLGRTSYGTQCDKEHSRLMNPLSGSAKGLLVELKSIRMHKGIATPVSFSAVGNQVLHNSLNP